MPGLIYVEKNTDMLWPQCCQFPSFGTKKTTLRQQLKHFEQFENDPAHVYCCLKDLPGWQYCKWRFCESLGRQRAGFPTAPTIYQGMKAQQQSISLFVSNMLVTIAYDQMHWLCLCPISNAGEENSRKSTDASVEFGWEEAVCYHLSVQCLGQAVLPRDDQVRSLFRTFNFHAVGANNSLTLPLLFRFLYVMFLKRQKKRNMYYKKGTTWS